MPTVVLKGARKPHGVRILRGARARGPKVLFVHNNFPAQFGFLAEMMRREELCCASISSDEASGITGVISAPWKMQRGTTNGILQDAVRAEADMLRGRAAAESALLLKKSGFTPDVIIGHPGWGETLFLKEIYPRAKQVLYGEYYYRTTNSDFGFDKEFGTVGIEDRLKVIAKNATLAVAYNEADRIVCPTRYQQSLMPRPLQAMSACIHEGVDTARTRRRPNQTLRLPDGRGLDASAPVITFVNRCFEPLRGYHIFLRALPRLLAKVPNAQIVLIGEGSGRGYGAPCPHGMTWKEYFLNEVKGRLDRSRVHFLGRVSYNQFIAALSISAAHVYLTYPFVLSWSLLEAMATECCVVASNTAPVREVVEHDRNGILVDFFDHDGLSDALIEACTVPDKFGRHRKAARETILQRFDRGAHTAPAWRALLSEVLGHDMLPAPTLARAAADQTVAPSLARV